MTISCQKSKKEHSIIGTWSICFRDGEYREFKITDKYMLMLTLGSEQVSIFSNYIERNSLIWKSMDSEYSLPNNVDTVIIISQSNNRIVLKSKFMGTEIELNKIEDEIHEIDSTNLENWKRQTILNFQKRVELFNCPDLRTEDEKIIHDLELLEIEEIEIPIEIRKDSLN